MIVEASPWDELLTAFVTNKRSLSSVAPDVLLQVAERLKIVIYKKMHFFLKIIICKRKTLWSGHLLFLKVAAHCWHRYWRSCNSPSLGLYTELNLQMILVLEVLIEIRTNLGAFCSNPCWVIIKGSWSLWSRDPESGPLFCCCEPPCTICLWLFKLPAVRKLSGQSGQWRGLACCFMWAFRLATVWKIFPQWGQGGCRRLAMFWWIRACVNKVDLTVNARVQWGHL